MKLKKPNNFGRWEFFVGEEEEYRVPQQGFAKSSRALTIFVDAYFQSQAGQGKPEYLQAAKEEASKLHLEYWDYLSKLVEHQICLRNGGVSGGLCNSSGLGDDLHSFSEKVDSIIEKSPKAIKRLTTVILKSTLMKGKKIVKGATPKLSGCGGCGGKRSYSAKGNNMGRAGRLNKK